MKINSESTCFDIDFIRRVEKMYKAKYIYETELIEYGPVGAIFYQKNVDTGAGLGQDVGSGEGAAAGMEQGPTLTAKIQI